MSQLSATTTNETQPIQFTEDRLLALLRAEATTGTPGPAGALTSADIKERLGWGAARVNQMIRKLQDSGTIELVWADGRRVDGQRYRVPAWRVVGGGSLEDMADE